jgi:hypothetical protein
MMVQEQKRISIRDLSNHVRVQTHCIWAMKELPALALITFKNKRNNIPKEDGNRNYAD